MAPGEWGGASHGTPPKTILSGQSETTAAERRRASRVFGPTKRVPGSGHAVAWGPHPPGNKAFMQSPPRHYLFLEYLPHEDLLDLCMKLNANQELQSLPQRPLYDHDSSEAAMADIRVL